MRKNTLIAVLSVIVFILLLFSIPLFTDYFGESSGTFGITYVTDEHTGCEYVANGNGGITPRIQHLDGKEITRGCKEWVRGK